MFNRIPHARNAKKMRPTPDLITFTYPTLTKGKVWYLSFMALDPSLGSMRRKRIKLMHIKDVKQRNRYALHLIYNIIEKLEKGWSPWAPSADLTPTRYPFETICKDYLVFITHSLKQGTLRKDSEKSYRSYLNVFQTWITDKITYCDEVTMPIIVDFLDYIYLEKKNSSTTRNNYLVWLGNFFEWCLQHGYVKEKPTTGIKALPKHKGKNRTLIDNPSLKRLHDYLLEKNPNFLLVTQMIMYCFIRPKELSMLKIGDIHLHEGTITIPGEVSKNHVTAPVTLPSKVIHTMLDLDLFSHGSEEYIFSDSFKPGRNYEPPKRMSDYWHYHVSPDLNFPANYKLYSLKDTGITKLLHKIDPLSVRDQARHSDISITNIYAQHDEKATESIRGFEAEL